VAGKPSPQKSDPFGGKFDQRGVTHDLATSTQIAHWSYAQAFHAGGMTWQRGKTLVHVSPVWERLFICP
jgi:hypothetical protein